MNVTRSSIMIVLISTILAISASKAIAQANPTFYSSIMGLTKPLIESPLLYEYRSTINGILGSSLIQRGALISLIGNAWAPTSHRFDVSMSELNFTAHLDISNELPYRWANSPRRLFEIFSIERSPGSEWESNQSIQFKDLVDYFKADLFPIPSQFSTEQKALVYLILIHPLLLAPRWMAESFDLIPKMGVTNRNRELLKITQSNLLAAKAFDELTDIQTYPDKLQNHLLRVLVYIHKFGIGLDTSVIAGTDITIGDIIYTLANEFLEGVFMSYNLLTALEVSYETTLKETRAKIDSTVMHMARAFGRFGYFSRSEEQTLTDNPIELFKDPKRITEITRSATIPESYYGRD